MSAPPAACCGAAGGLRRWACLLLPLILDSVPLAASRRAPATQGELAPNQGVVIGPETHPAPVGPNRWRALQRLPPPRASIAPAPLPLDASRPPAAQACVPQATVPGSDAARSGRLPPSVDLSTGAPRNASGAAAAVPGGAGSLAVCPANPALQTSAVGRHATICRLYIFEQGGYASCSGAFVTGAHILTAGHSVSNGDGSFSAAERAGRYGVACCAPDPSDDIDACAPDAQFDIVGVTTTAGWLKNGVRDNDAAVLKVARQRQTSPGFGVPAPWGSIASSICTPRTFEWDGFPGSDDRKTGCVANFQGRLRYSITEQTPDPCPAPDSGTQIQLFGNSCGSMSGGPLWNRYDDHVVGALSASTSDCSPEGFSWVQFTQIMLEPGESGVLLRNLIDQLA